MRGRNGIQIAINKLDELGLRRGERNWMGTPTPLRVLNVEDSEDDAILLLRELRQGGYDPISKRVDTPESMAAELDRDAWDIIVSDYVMPRFNGLEALRLMQKKGLDLPFIIVSGKADEDTLVGAMKAGVHDYVLKDKLARLVPAVERELREAVVRQGRKKAREALRESEEEARRLAAENAVMAEIGRIISSTLNIEEVYEHFAEKVRTLIPFDRIVITLIQREEGKNCVAYSSGFSLPERRIGDLFFLNGSVNEAMLEIKSGLIFQPQDANEVQREFPGLITPFREGVRSFLCVPMISRNKVFGGLHFQSRKILAYMEGHLKLAQRVSAHISGAVANAQLFSERRQAEESLSLKTALLSGLLDSILDRVFFKDL
jgi:DNA-binding response OmpR family regulator